MSRPRVNFYIDGFNLYKGIVQEMRDNYPAAPNCKWLDIRKLAIELKSRKDKLESIKFFTALIPPRNKRSKGMRDRQDAYLSAIGSLDKVQIIKGEYITKTEPLTIETNCDIEGCQYKEFIVDKETYKEKQTDVNIATEMLKDAYEGNCEKMHLICGDGDLKAAIELIAKSNPPKATVVVHFPKGRECRVLKPVCSTYFDLNRYVLQNCLLPNLVNVDGVDIECPPKWTVNLERPLPNL